MSTFERTVEYLNGRTVTITSWQDDAGSWKAGAPGFVLKHGRADGAGSLTRQAAVSQVLREIAQIVPGENPRKESSLPGGPRRQ